MADIVLKQRDVEKLLKENRRRVVTSEHEVATAKLVYEARADEYWTVNQSRIAFEAAHPWLVDEGIEIPEELRDKGEAGNLVPPYETIRDRWERLCERCDKISAQLHSAPAVIQRAMNNQVEYEIKNGQMMSAASAFAAILQIAAAGSRYIDSERDREDFKNEVLKIRRELIDANPHLVMSSTG